MSTVQMTANPVADPALGQLTAIRRQLHQHPEVGLDLPRTQRVVLDALADLPLEITTGRSLSSVVAVLRGVAAPNGPRRSVLLRADMDALPLAEITGLAYASQVPGVMHACGHDLHTAMLIGAAQQLSTERAVLAGDVVFVFQPGEEGGWDGAGRMIQEGLLTITDPAPIAAYALHVQASRYPHGVFATKSGPILSGSDELRVVVRGRGGHGAAPHLAVDPVPPICEMVTALQTMVTRSFNAFDPVIMTVGRLSAGTNGSVIPGQADFSATVRTFSEASRSQVRDRVTTLITGIAQAHRVEVEIDYQEGYPVTVNDTAETEFSTSVIAGEFGADRLQLMDRPMTPSEDFARVQAVIPGSYIMLGACPPDVDPERAPDNHSGTAVFDDAVLGSGARLLATLARRRLQEP